MFSPQFSEAFNPRNGAAHGIIDLKPSSDWWPHRVAHPAAAFCGIDLGPAAPLPVTGTAGLPLGKAYVVLRLAGDMIYCGSELLCTAISYTVLILKQAKTHSTAVVLQVVMINHDCDDDHHLTTHDLLRVSEPSKSAASAHC